MSLLTLKDICLENENELVNLNCDIMEKNFYVFYSNNDKTLDDFFDVLVYPEKIKFGEIKYHNLNIKNFDKNAYRKSIISVISSSNNFIDYLSPIEFLNLFSIKDKNITEILNVLKFPLDSYNSKISNLNREQTNRLTLAKLLLKKSEIIIIDRFFDDVLNNNNESELLDEIVKTIYFSNIAVIFLSKISAWDNDIFKVFNI